MVSAPCPAVVASAWRGPTPRALDAVQCAARKSRVVLPAVERYPGSPTPGVQNAPGPVRLGRSGRKRPTAPWLPRPHFAFGAHTREPRCSPRHR